MKEFIREILISLKNYIVKKRRVFEFLKSLIPYRVYVWLKPRLEYPDPLTHIIKSQPQSNQVDLQDADWYEYHKTVTFLRRERERSRVDFRPRQPNLISIQEKDMTAVAAKLQFPQIAQPVISIIIPFYKQPRLTLECLASIEKFTKSQAYEIIVVDDNSKDDMVGIFVGVENIKIIHNEKQEGFGASCNKGAQQAKGEYLVFLNNDAQVTDGWLSPLLDEMKSNPSVGAVGPKVLNVNGTLQEAGALIQPDGSAILIGFDDDPDAAFYNQNRDVEYCSGVCLMVRADLFRQLGGFDSHFAPAYYEDVDLSFKIRADGYSIRYAANSKIYHHLSATTKEISSEYKTWLVTKNRQKFIERWQAEIDQLTTLKLIVSVDFLPTSEQFQLINLLGTRFSTGGLCYQWTGELKERIMAGGADFCLKVSTDLLDPPLKMDVAGYKKDDRSDRRVDQVVALMQMPNYLLFDGHPLLFLSEIVSSHSVESVREFWNTACKKGGLKPPFLCLVSDIEGEDHSNGNNTDIARLDPPIKSVDDVFGSKQKPSGRMPKPHHYQRIIIHDGEKSLSLGEFQGIQEECIKMSREVHPPHRRFILLEGLIQENVALPDSLGSSNAYEFLEAAQNALDANLLKKKF